MKGKMMAAFAAAGVEVDEFIAAAAAEKEANRLSRAREATIRELKRIREMAQIRRAARKLAAAEKEARRAARRTARRTRRNFARNTTKAFKAYIEALKEEALITNANSYEKVTVITPVYGSEMLPEMTGVSSEVQLAACCELYGLEKGETEALFTIPGTSVKAVSCKGDGFKAMKNADIVITDEGVFNWLIAVDKIGEKQYDYSYDRNITVIKGEVVQFTLKDGSTKVVILATNAVKLVGVCSIELPFKINFDTGRVGVYKVETQEDITWVINNCQFISEMTERDDYGYRFATGAYVSLKAGAQLPQREEKIITFTLEELKAAYSNNNGQQFCHEYDFIDVDNDTLLDGTVDYCGECGFFSEPHGDGTEWDDELHCVTQLTALDFDLIVTDGRKFFGVHETVCEHCLNKRGKKAVSAATTIEEALEALEAETINIVDYEICPSCGKVMMSHYGTLPTVTKPVQVLYRLTGSTVESFIVATRECERCKTIRYGAGLDGVKDDITVNHGLWAFRRDENNVHGALRRLREFLQLSKTAEFCATEVSQFVGDFGVTIEHPKITAAFGYGDSDAWSERDGDQRYATRNFDYGIKTKKEFDVEVERNLQYGHAGYKYIELIVSMGTKSTIRNLWIKDDFFRGHPHFSRALVEVADAAGLRVVIVDTDTAKITAMQQYHELCMEAGFNALVSHCKVEKESEDYDSSDSWSLGHKDENRVNVRYYLFNLLVDRVIKSNVKRDRKAIILCGLPGSGKSTIARTLKDYTIVDPDIVKWLLPEYKGGNASFVHRESSKIASWVHQYLAVRGVNVVAPMVGDNESLKRVKHVYEEAEYQLDIRFVDTCPEKCFERIQGRNRSIDISIDELQESYENIMANIEVLK